MLKKEMRDRSRVSFFSGEPEFRTFDMLRLSDRTEVSGKLKPESDRNIPL
ncbi:MAG: hypothetical protein WBD58_11635 [Geitlerinemataceae cyanobacterium]